MLRTHTVQTRRAARGGGAALSPVDPRLPGCRRAAFEDAFVFQWHVTDRCALACSHCYRTSPRADLSRDELLTIYEKMCRYLSRASRPGRIHFAGGEPAASPHLLELGRRAHADGLASRLLTSGVCVNDAAAERLYGAGFRWAQVSVEGPRTTHDAIRGAGTFDRAMRGAAALRRAGLEVTLAATLSTRNLDCIEDMPDLARGLASRLYFSRLVPVRPEQRAEVLPPGRWGEAMARIRAIREFSVPLRDPTFRPLSLSPARARAACAVGGCSVGYNSLCVESNGDVYPCRRLPLVVGNLLRQEVAEVLEADLVRALADRDRLRGRCGRCVYRWLCGGCRGLAYAWSGDVLAEDPQCPFSAARLHPLASWLPGGRNLLTPQCGGLLPVGSHHPPGKKDDV